MDSEGYFGDEDIYREYHFSTEAWFAVTSWQNSIENQNASGEPDYKKEIFRKIQDYCLRFALIIHAMREACGEIPESLMIDSETAIKATLLADYFYEQALIAYEIVLTGGTENDKFFMLLNGLNDEFTTSQALAVGEHMGISRATVYRYLAVGPNDPFLRSLKHGHYEKIK